MCTLTVISGPSLRLVFSRDEQRDRPEALAPRWREIRAWDGASLQAIWPADPLGGGTWIAAAESGLALCLINRNLEPRPVLPPGLVSRGRIIPQLISAPSARIAVGALRELDLELFAPFRLLAVENGAAGPMLLEAEWDRASLIVREHAAPVCLVSSGLGDSLVADRVPLFFELVSRGGGAAEQDAFHAHAWPDRRPVSVLMSRGDARTVSVTTLELSRGAAGPRVKMSYRAIADRSDAADAGVRARSA